MKRVLIPILVIAVFGFARTAVTNYNYAGREFQIKIHDVNQVEMCISNFGKLIGWRLRPLRKIWRFTWEECFITPMAVVSNISFLMNRNWQGFFGIEKRRR